MTSANSEFQAVNNKSAICCQDLDNLSNRKLWMLFKELENLETGEQRLYQEIGLELARRNLLQADCYWSSPH